MSFISFEGNQIYFNVKGEGSPLLFGHSYLWDSNMWTDVIDYLSNDFCCVAVDLPGHGQSECVESLSLKKLSDIHKTVMNFLGYSSFDMVGLSIGGMWGALLVNDPDVQVNKFVIMNSSLSSEPQEKLMLYMGMLNSIEELGFIPDQIIDAIAPGFFSKRGISQYLENYKAYLRSISAKQISSITDIGRAFINRGDLLKGFKNFKGKLMVIAGEEDHYRTIEESDQISNAFNIDTKLIPAGHISVLEQNKVAVEQLRSFLF